MKNLMYIAGLLILMVVLPNICLMAGDKKMSDKDVEISLSPLKDKFSFGGPVGIVLTIRNKSKNDMVCDPFFSDHYLSRIRFFSDNNNVITKDDEHMFGGLSGPVTIKANNSYKALIYLNRYLAFKKPGTFDIKYKFDFMICNASTDGKLVTGSAVTISGTNSFSITLEVVKEETLEKELEFIAQGLSDENTLRLWENDYQEPSGWEMTEAFSYLDTPLCIDYLVMILSLNSNYATMALEAIGRFQGEKAEKIIISALDNSDPDFVEIALDALKKKNILIDNKKVNQLLTSQNGQIKYITMDYLSEMGNVFHIPMLQPILKDKEKYIAKKAAECIKKIEARENLRKKWFLIYSLLFVILVAAIAVFRKKAIRMHPNRIPPAGTAKSA